VFEVRFAWAVALFLLLAAGDHLLMVAPRVRSWYEANLLKGVNYARWAEYSVSASVMVILIGLLCGINDLYAVIGIFGVNAAMILFGALMEQVNVDTARVNWLPFVFGCLAGAVPWIAVVVAVVRSSTNGPTNEVPAFVAQLDRQERARLAVVRQHSVRLTTSFDPRTRHFSNRWTVG